MPDNIVSASCALGALILLGACRADSAAHPRFAKARRSAHSVTNYVDAKQLTDLTFGTRSHWLQPWRAYLDTWPASRLRDAVGINFQFNIPPKEADAVCKHLAKNGFRYVRLEFGWGSVNWDDAGKLNDQAAFDAIVGACKKNGLRPLFLLNAHHGDPGPMKTLTVHLTQAAHKGDRTLHVDPQDTANLTAGRTGLSNLTGLWAAENLFTDVRPDGTVTLSKPLPKDLPQGTAPAATLKYLPFYPSRLKDGSRPPEFAETLRGWLQYVRTIGVNAERVLGTQNQPDAGFDVEIWNELSFGSNFLDINKYYDHPVAEGTNPIADIVQATVSFLRDSHNGFPKVGIGDGFENQRPWASGSAAPPGLTAIDKHPYPPFFLFPEAQKPNGTRPLNALGQLDADQIASNVWRDHFVPAYACYFPEYQLTGIQTETMVRDLAPIPTPIYRVQHGRSTHPSEGGPAPTVWITEVNISPKQAKPGYAEDAQTGEVQQVQASVDSAAGDRMKAKALLRYLTAYVNKGVRRIYFFTAQDKTPLGLGLVSNAFFEAASSGTYPADDASLTSPEMKAVRQLTDHMQGDIAASAVRPLKLNGIEEPDALMQFAGDPTSADTTPNPRPALMNSDVLAFLPFQATAHKYVVPVYVMTRNMANLYHRGAASDDVKRFDMPEETFRLTIGGLQGSGLKASLYDPLDDQTYPASVSDASSNAATVTVKLTDWPRLLILETP